MRIIDQQGGVWFLEGEDEDEAKRSFGDDVEVTFGTWKGDN